MDCNKFSSLGVAPSDVARPLASTQTLQTGSHPVCARAQSLFSASSGQRAEGRGQEKALQSIGRVQLQLPALCHAAVGCLNAQVEPERTVRAGRGGCHPRGDLVPGLRTVQHWPDLCCHLLTLISHPVADFWTQSSISCVLQGLAGFETAASSLGWVR